MTRVLFIDDDPFTLETLTRAAQLLGHQAMVAGTGEDATRLVKEEAPDVIFTDMQLPDTDGANLVGELRKLEITAHIPMYILSASPIVDAVERARAAGATAYLNKPIRLQTLLEILEKHSTG
jgi:CheY-like chemotaxis protein